MVLNAPIVGMATTRDGKGYWLVAADGGIFTFGDANFYGSAVGADLPDAAVGMVASPDGEDSSSLTENGVVLPYGDAQAFGGLSLDPTATQIRHHREQPGDRLLAARPPGLAVRLLHRHSRTYVSGAPSTIAGAVASQIRAGPRHPGPLLQPVRTLRGVVRPVRHLGLGAGGHPDSARTPSPATSGTRAATYGVDLPPTATPAVGDAILYGTGPQTTSTSRHARYRDRGPARRRHHVGRGPTGARSRRLPLGRAGWAVLLPTPPGTTACRSTGFSQP